MTQETNVVKVREVYTWIQSHLTAELRPNTRQSKYQEVLRTDL